MAEVVPVLGSCAAISCVVGAVEAGTGVGEGEGTPRTICEEMECCGVISSHQPPINWKP